RLIFRAIRHTGGRLMPRPKKPAEVHRRQGTYQPSRHAGPALPVSIPEMPADLPPAAQAAWKNITQMLFSAGLVAELDQLSLRMLVESVWLYHEAHDDIVAKGLVIQTTNGNWVQNPSVGIRNKAWLQIVTLCKQFGMTPTARTGLGPGAVPEDDDA